MKNSSYNKLILLWIASVLLFAIPEQAHAYLGNASENLLAALSWTCRKGGCNKKKHPTHASEAAETQQPTQEKTDINKIRMKPQDTTKYKEKAEEEELTEKQFFSQLDNEGKRIFDSLNSEGKKLALRLSKQFIDKNQAVKEAAKNTGKESAEAD